MLLRCTETSILKQYRETSWLSASYCRGDEIPLLGLPMWRQRWSIPWRAGDSRLKSAEALSPKQRKICKAFCAKLLNSTTDRAHCSRCIGIRTQPLVARRRGAAVVGCARARQESCVWFYTSVGYSCLHPGKASAGAPF